MGLIKLLKKSLKKLKKIYLGSIKTNIYKLNREQEKIIKRLYKPKARAPKKVDVYVGNKMVALESPREAWLYKNPKALKSVKQGLKDAKAGFLAPIKFPNAAGVTKEEIRRVREDMKKEMVKIKKAMKDLTEDGTGWRG